MSTELRLRDFDISEDTGFVPSFPGRSGSSFDRGEWGARGCLFWHGTWRARCFNGSPAFSEHVPIMFAPTSLGTLLLSMQHESLMGI